MHPSRHSFIRSFVRSFGVATGARATFVRSSARVMSRVTLVSPTTASAVRTGGRRAERCANRARGTHRRERAR